MNRLKEIMIVILLGFLISSAAGKLTYRAFSDEADSPSLQDKAVSDYEETDAQPPVKDAGAAFTYEELLARYKAVEADRNNLLAQAKALLRYKGEAEELNDKLNILKGELDAVTPDKKELYSKVKEFKAQTENLRKEKSRIEAERDKIKEAYEEAAKKIKELEKQISKLKKENKAAMDGLDKAGREIAKLKENTGKVEERIAKSVARAGKRFERERAKLKRDFEEKILEIEAERDDARMDNESAEAEIRELEAKIKDYKNKYAAAVKKNNVLEKQVNNLPYKFSEIARQNVKLKEQSAKMHYNLGVFYTKQAEYSRAVSEFKKALEINPDDPYTHFNLGYIYAQYRINRKKAIEHFRNFLRLAKGDDKDIDWARRYLLTWETFEGKAPMK